MHLRQMISGCFCLMLGGVLSFKLVAFVLEVRRHLRLSPGNVDWSSIRIDFAGVSLAGWHVWACGALVSGLALALIVAGVFIVSSAEPDGQQDGPANGSRPFRSV